ncbi:MAG: methionine--tRNA ligase [marine bacterium B5-7]|nr:MAG: methionine--tRNA ligase [marine bacterium B5-7]
MTQKRRILVTSALTYANGPLHLGHMVEHIQTDIWARFQRLRGHECYYVSGDDAHGTPIMLQAQKRGITPEQLIEETHAAHKQDFSDFHIDVVDYGSTHTEENRQQAESIYHALEKNGDITKKEIKQAFDPEKKMFLPDRFVRGTCPRCKTPDQVGDSCENCGATYTPLDLIDAKSVVSGATPIEKSSIHYFFKLSNYQDFLTQWMDSGSLQPEVRNKLQEWFGDGLRDWDISRDSPYFGFNIPGEKDKYFYVWLDAPIGYIAIFKTFCEKNNITFDDFWQSDKTELYHFIGKDILYFHSLFWPAMLKGAGLRTPTGVFTHGYLTINGEKMSKSRGTFIKARTYLNHFEPTYLRYYYAAKLNGSVEDIDFKVDDFLQRTNTDLVNKVVNIASRCAGFIHKKFEGKLTASCEEQALYDEFSQAADDIAAAFEKRDTCKAVRLMMALADKANQYIDSKKPWQMVKDQDQLAAAHAVCSVGINLFKVLMTYLKPIVPTLAERAEAFLNITLQWDNLATPLLDHTVNPFKPLLSRIESKQTEAMMEESKTDAAPAVPAPAADSWLGKKPLKPEITIDDFSKIDLRIAKIISADHVEGADKLIQLKLDIGGEIRQVFAGAKASYAPEDLVGRHTIMVANLKPRKMRFGLSEGMIAFGVGERLFLLEPEEGAEAGMPVQ